MEVRKRERPPALRALIEGMAEQLQTVTQGFNELRVEVRSLKKRLSRYEKAPPMFPQAMLDQIKRLHAFGLSAEAIAGLYRIDHARVARIMDGTEMPLVVYRPQPAAPRQSRRLVDLEVRH